MSQLVEFLHLIQQYAPRVGHRPDRSEGERMGGREGGREGREGEERKGKGKGRRGWKGRWEGEGKGEGGEWRGGRGGKKCITQQVIIIYKWERTRWTITVEMRVGPTVVI